MRFRWIVATLAALVIGTAVIADRTLLPAHWEGTNFVPPGLAS